MATVQSEGLKIGEFSLESESGHDVIFPGWSRRYMMPYRETHLETLALEGFRALTKIAAYLRGSGQLLSRWLFSHT